MIGTTTIPRENLEFIAKDIGSELVPFLTPEQLVNLTPQQRLVVGMSLEQRLAGMSLEQRLAGMTLEDEKKLFEFLLKKYGHQNGQNGR